MIGKIRWSYFVGVLLCLQFVQSWANEVRLAVASNFAYPVAKMKQQFEKKTGYKCVIALGATGQLYAQIVNGAPFEVLLAADEETPLKLEQSGFAVGGTRKTYAIGQLVLWSKQAGLVDPQGLVLRQGAFTKLAIASPKLAPYGRAAQQALHRLGVWEKVVPKLVEGANIGQTYQFVNAGAADLGFVALSQVQQDGRLELGSAWRVPESLYSPILQDAVLLKHGQNNPAARAFMQYLQTDEAKALIQSSGYQVP